MAKRFVREPEACGRLGCGRSTFRENYRLNDPDDPYVPGTQIKRVKRLHLGPRNIAFEDSDLDRLINALIEAGGHSESKAKGKRKAARAASAPPAQRRKRK
jgi:predicted DNA-binding transcriptional regulator AlpA